MAGVCVSKTGTVARAVITLVPKRIETYLTIENNKQPYNRLTRLGIGPMVQLTAPYPGSIQLYFSGNKTNRPA